MPLDAVVAAAPPTVAAAAEAAGDDRRDRAVHRLGHQVGEDRARRADDHAGDDQRGVVRARRRSRPRDRPVKALSSEITTGMSAPPIGSTTKLPSIAAASSMPTTNSSSRVGAGDDRDARSATATRAAASVDQRLRAADRDRPAGEDLLQLAEGDVRAPERDRADDRREQREDRDVGRLGRRSRRVSGTRPRRSATTAPPPTPLNSATICGIAVIFTWRAAGTPTAVPMAMPTMIRPQLPIRGSSSVAIDGDRHADRGDAVAAHRRPRPGQPASARR